MSLDNVSPQRRGVRDRSPGWGFDDDDAAWRSIGALLEPAAKRKIPLYPKTHRATVFQDMWRTISLTNRFPQLLFNADYSHWYTGQEMPYGGLNWKLNLLAPIFDWVGVMHGRMGDPGAMQVEVWGAEDHRVFVQHFCEMWTWAFRSFRRKAGLGAYLCYAGGACCQELLLAYQQ